MELQRRPSTSFKERRTTQLVWYWQQSVTHAKPLLLQLHWLPVRQRIQYKVAVLSRKVRMTGAPSYLNQHLVQHEATRQTRSTALPLLTIPRTNTEFARRSYSYSAPFIWNSLPGNVLNCNSEHTFKKHLKTFLFNSCFYAA